MYEITDRYGTTNHEFTDYEILEKLGRAIYVPRALIKQAERAREAVDYLAENGVFGAPEDTSEV